MSCENACYEAQINGCDDITLKAGLAASTAYHLRVSKSGSGLIYQRTLTSDSDGNLFIDTSLYPAGLLIPGFFHLTLRLASDNSVQPLTFNSIPYTCVLFQVVNVDVVDGDESPLSTIQ